jgi:hypothetical protein
MTAAARRGDVNFFVEYGGNNKRCRVTEAALLNKARVSKKDTSSTPLIATLREASLPTASRQHPGESIVDFVGGRPIIDLRLANFDLLFCDAYARRAGWRWRGRFAGRGMIVGSDGNDGDLMLSLTNIMTIRQQRCLEGVSRPRHVLA